MLKVQVVGELEMYTEFGLLIIYGSLYCHLDKKFSQYLENRIPQLVSISL